ncbi:MAG: hypothetical protein GXY76_20195 [Chloroflexi bacterium]|nr:hypothetical protein [Chloroflexota bacterium]
MKLYDLGAVSWQDSQLIYHTLPRLGHHGLILLRPSTPYFCIGYHQDVEQEVDVAYCREHHIPIFRREVGGGAVYLDGQQLFFQLILPREHPLAAQTKERFYQQLLEPVVQTYKAMGIDCRYKPVNDVITTQGRKISGTGAAEIAGHVILVGNLIADFNYEMMTRILRVPDEKYRDKVFKSMTENLSTIKRELGAVPTWEEMSALLASEFAKVLGPLEPSALPEGVQAKRDELWAQFSTDEWLYKRGRRQAERAVKIAAGTEVRQRMFKAPGGLIRALFVVKENKLGSVSLSGDFFIYPADKLGELEAALEGVALEQAEAAIDAFYAANRIDSPGLTPADLAKVLVA